MVMRKFRTSLDHGDPNDVNANNEDANGVNSPRGPRKLRNGSSFSTTSLANSAANGENGSESPSVRRRRSRIPSEEAAESGLLNFLVAGGQQPEGLRERNTSVGNLGKSHIGLFVVGQC